MFAIRSLISAVIVATLALGSMAEEPMMKSSDSPSMKVAIASHSHLNDATALINKNADMSSQNLAITRSNVIASQNDVIAAEEAMLKPNSVATPSDLTLTGERDMLSSPDVEDTKDGAIEEQYYRYRYGYRHRFYYPYFRGGYYGWRYPIRYWNYYGPRYYGGYCPFGRVYGDYYYC